MKYNRPQIDIAEADFVLLSLSEMGPGATDIGAPNVSNECKSVWDEVENTYNIKEESCEVYE